MVKTTNSTTKDSEKAEINPMYRRAKFVLGDPRTRRHDRQRHGTAQGLTANGGRILRMWPSGNFYESAFYCHLPVEKMISSFKIIMTRLNNVFS